LRILIVDDDAATLAALQELLEGEGHQVVTAANGSEALATLRQDGPFGVILLDIMMPVMNGYEFRETQLQDPRLAAIPVIVLTADGRAQQKGSRLGARRIFQKPVSPPELLSEIRRCGVSTESPEGH